MKKPERSRRARGSEPARAPVTTKITPRLRSRLEASAEKGTRTLGSEIEHRLELSFRLNLTGQEGIGAVFDNQSATDFLSSVGSVFGDLLRMCSDRGLSEMETRKSLRAALSVLVSRHLWMGETFPDADNNASSADGKLRDLPPGQLGRRLAVEHMIWDAAWSDRAAVDDALDGRVANRWTGDGSVIELGKPPKSDPARRAPKDLSLDEIEADPRFEKQKNLHLYKRID
ncbi:hypothetical protein [Methylobacterium longum]|uniref:Uncharacterized protein n=1 Tax=Methylobacterium longum TaxID=767694 RepID=A0ABT8AYZ7_9HYPH|nr:hypothetical protein [Methylobacterium longum]MDN3575073.1 hypothetical protein [Methylobacterium longum]GJE14782.1 hypothetical protein FOHLNKBM_5857 [Methylobacterium longum]